MRPDTMTAINRALGTKRKFFAEILDFHLDELGANAMAIEAVLANPTALDMLLRNPTTLAQLMCSMQDAEALRRFADNPKAMLTISENLHMINPIIETEVLRTILEQSSVFINALAGSPLRRTVSRTTAHSVTVHPGKAFVLSFESPGAGTMARGSVGTFFANPVLVTPGNTTATPIAINRFVSTLNVQGIPPGDDFGGVSRLVTVTFVPLS